MSKAREWLEKHRQADEIVYPIEGGNPLYAVYKFSEIPAEIRRELDKLIRRANTKRESDRSEG